MLFHHLRQRRQEHQRQHHREVFDDEPAHGDAAVRGIQLVALLERPSSTTVLATDSASPSTSPPPMPQPHSAAMPVPMAVATAICAMAPGMAMPRHGQQRVHREMQADAEHQQDDADLGELGGDLRSRRRTRA